MRRAAVALVVLAAARAGSGGPGAEAAPAPRPVGRAGETVGGHTLTVAAAPHLRFGRHLDVAVTSRSAAVTPPHVRLVWSGLYRTVAFEMTAEGGEVVPVTAEVAGWASTPDYASVTARLRPTGPHARGVYLAPGRYRLRAVVDARRNPFDRSVSWAAWRRRPPR